MRKILTKCLFLSILTLALTLIYLTLRYSSYEYLLIEKILNKNKTHESKLISLYKSKSYKLIKEYISKNRIAFTAYFKAPSSYIIKSNKKYFHTINAIDEVTENLKNENFNITGKKNNIAEDKTLPSHLKSAAKILVKSGNFKTIINCKDKECQWYDKTFETDDKVKSGYFFKKKYYLENKFYIIKYFNSNERLIIIYPHTFTLNAKLRISFEIILFISILTGLYILFMNKLKNKFLYIVKHYFVRKKYLKDKFIINFLNDINIFLNSDEIIYYIFNKDRSLIKRIKFSKKFCSIKKYNKKIFLKKNIFKKLSDDIAITSNSPKSTSIPIINNRHFLCILKLAIEEKPDNILRTFNNNIDRLLKNNFNC